MKKVTSFLSTLALLATISSLSGHGQESAKLNELMRQKLEHAQKVLEGIAVNDCNKIARHAEELIEISKTLEWKVFKTPQYEMQSNEFRRTAETLVQKAQEKNLDGAALAYVDLTLNCVKCHKYVREVRMTRRD